MSGNGSLLWRMLARLRRHDFLLGFLIALWILVVGPFLYTLWEVNRPGGMAGPYLGKSVLSEVMAQLALSRPAIQDAVNSNGEWPPDLHPFLTGLDGRYAHFDSPEPWVLRAILKRNDLSGAWLEGCSLLFRFDRETQNWTCDGRTDRPLPASVLPENCLGADPEALPDPAVEGYTLMWRMVWVPTVAALVLLAAGAYLYLVLHPAGRDAAQPGGLLRVPLHQLPKVRRLLFWSRRLRPLLEQEGIPPARFREALGFAGLPPHARCALIRRRLQAGSEDASPETGSMTLRLPDRFPLKLNRLRLYCPPPGLPADAVVERLRGLDADLRVCLVVADAPDLNAALRPFGEDGSNLWLVPDSGELTALLLAPDPLEPLLRLMTRQLRVTHLSPYQTRGGLVRDSQFFGRERILAQVLSGDPANFLFIGGRQLGKSSLMKRIQRRAAAYPNLLCDYLVLHDADLPRALAHLPDFPSDIPPESLPEYLAALPVGKRRLILVDEADPFMRADRQAGYPFLNTLRAVTEAGRCHFIFAGFWDLYEAAVLDYQSPLRNFAEPIVIGELESAACRDLATRPMRLLGLDYADEAAVDLLLVETGQRANLIAIACDEMLRRLGNRDGPLDQALVRAALDGHAVHDALLGWTGLSPDPLASRLDRVIAYATVEAGRFTTGGLIHALNALDFVFEPEQLNRSLARLELAYILRREGAVYRYCVPLFRRLVLDQQPRDLLREELRAQQGLVAGL